MTVPTFEEADARARPGSPFSNGTEGECWMANNCHRCVHDAPARRDEWDKGCPLILVAYLGKTPAEWLEKEPLGLADRYTCLYFRDENDPGPGEPTPIPDPPGQLTLCPREGLERPGGCSPTRGRRRCPSVADTKTTPCWVLTSPRRRAGRVHYRSAEKAVEVAARPHSPVAGFVPRQLAERCLTVSCGCGYVLDENVDGVVHLSEPEVGVALEACGWVRDGDGWRCPECVQEAP